jgi:hypothetical protein
VALLAAAPVRAEEPLRVVVEGAFEASPAAARGVLLDLENFGRWFPWISEWRVLSRGADTAHVYGRQDVPWPGRDRDYVASYHWRSEGDVFLLEAVGVPGAEPKPPRGVTRIHTFRSEWRIESDGSGGTRARYTAEGPLDGSVQRWLARYQWRSHTRRVMEGLATELERTRREATARPFSPRRPPSRR